MNSARFGPPHPRLVLLGTAMALSGVALVTFAPPASAPGAQRRPRISIGSPSAGATINRGVFVTARVQARKNRKPQRVQFQLARPGSNKFETIEGAVPEGMFGAPAALFDTTSLPSGDYRLRARLLSVAHKGAKRKRHRGFVNARQRERSAGRAISSKPVTVHVNEQPFAVADVTLESFTGPQQFPPSPPVSIVRFDASRSIDRDGRVASVSWDFEDGSPPVTGTTVTRAYSTTGKRAFTVTVTDDRSGTQTTHYIIDVEPDPNAPTTNAQITTQRKDKCVCKKMTIVSTGAIADPEPGFDFSVEDKDAGPRMPRAELGNLGAFNEGAKDGKLDVSKKGPADFTVVCRFEVIAELEEFSLPPLCQEGQRVQRTWVVGGVTDDLEGKFSSDPRYDSKKSHDDPYDKKDSPLLLESGKCSYGGARWCDDSYHGGGNATGVGAEGYPPPTKFKRYVKETRIEWIDAPGFTRLSKGSITAGGATYKAKFEATVSPGKCHCTWEVLIEVDKSGTVKHNEVTNVKCD